MSAQRSVRSPRRARSVDPAVGLPAALFVLFAIFVALFLDSSNALSASPGSLGSATAGIALLAAGIGVSVAIGGGRWRWGWIPVFYAAWLPVVAGYAVAHRSTLGLRRLLLGAILPPALTPGGGRVELLGRFTWADLLVVGGAATLWSWRQQRRGPLPVWSVSPRAGSATAGALIVAASTLWVCPVAWIVVRQYPERRVALGREAIRGSIAAPWLWTCALALALGTATVCLIALPLARRLRLIDTSVMTPHRLMLVGVVAASFVWRVTALLRIAPARTDGGDPLFYHTQANGLVHGRGFIEPLNWIAHGASIPTALHGPGYPVYLSFFSRLGADTFFDHRMASSLIGAGSVLLTGLIARRLAGPTAGITAAVLAAVYPNMWTIDGVLFPEGLFIFCCALATLFAYRWYDRRHTADAVGLGLAIGAAALTRGEGLFLLAILVLPLMWFARGLGRSQRIRQMMWCGLGAVVLLGPWMVRNAATFERFVPLSTNGNELHVYSNCESTYSGRFIGFWSFACQTKLRDPDGDGTVDFEPAGDESETAAYWQKVGFTYAREHASRLPAVLAARLGRQWELFRPLQNAEFAPIEGRNTGWAKVALAMYYPMVVGAFVGVRRLRRRGVPVLPLGAHFLGVTITALYAYGTIRFRAPAEFALCVLAGVGAAPLVGRAVAALRRPDGAVAATTSHDAWLTGPHGLRLRWSRAWLLAAGFVAVVAALPLRGLYRTPGSTMEEGFMLTFPERVLRGDIPNVDFLHLYGPGSLHVLAAVYRVFGTNLFVERSFGLLQHLLIVTALYTLCRPWGRIAAAAAASASIMLVFTPIGLSALAWNGAIGLGLWSVACALKSRAAGARSWHFAAASGALAGLALTFRPDIVVALALAHAFVWWPARRLLVRAVLPGLAVGMTSLWVHLVAAGPSAAFRGMLLDPVFKLRGGRTLPAPPSTDHLDGALQVIAEKFPPWWRLPALSAPHQLFLWFFATPLIALSVVIAGWWSRRRNPGQSRPAALLAVGLFGLGIVQQAFQRPDSAHFAWVGMVSVPLLIPAVIEVLTHRRARASGPNAGRRVLAACALVGSLLLVVMPFFSLRIYLLHVRQSVGQMPPGLLVERGDRYFYLGDTPPWKASNALIADLDARLKPGERLLVGPADLRQTAYSDAFFYHLFPELSPATKYIEMDPGVANAVDSGLAADVASADWIILTRFWSGWIEPNDSVVFGPDDPNQIVERDFCLVGSYEHDLARLYRKCPGGGAPGPYEGPYDPKRDPAVEVRVPVPRRPDGTCTPTCVD